MNNFRTRVADLFHAILPILGTVTAFASLIGIALVLGAVTMMVMR